MDKGFQLHLEQEIAKKLRVGMKSDEARRQAAQQDTTARGEVRLVSDVASVRPGEPFTVGLHVSLDEGWRTPWPFLL